jgi:hypothetical protein
LLQFFRKCMCLCVWCLTLFCFFYNQQHQNWQRLKNVSKKLFQYFSKSLCDLWILCCCFIVTNHNRIEKFLTIFKNNYINFSKKIVKWCSKYHISFLKIVFRNKIFHRKKYIFQNKILTFEVKLLWYFEQFSRSFQRKIIMIWNSSSIKSR